MSHAASALLATRHNLAGMYRTPSELAGVERYPDALDCAPPFVPIPSAALSLAHGRHL